jgi:hypothetical protein
MKTYSRPYPEPESRTFEEWRIDLGLEYVGNVASDEKLDWDTFCFYPEVTLRKTKNSELYGWWRLHGDNWGECRTVEEWINDFNWDKSDLEEDDLNDLNLFLGHDEFWNWSSGKLPLQSKEESGLLGWIKKLFN